MGRDIEYNASIVRRQDLHPGLFHLWVAPDAGEYPPFQAGQYVSIGHRAGEDGSLVTRTYSIGSSAHKRESLELFIVHVDDGEFTSWLSRQPIGARLWLSPKASGGFTLEGFPEGRDLVLVATGTGVAPYISMYRTWRESPPWRRIVLVHGARLVADLGYRRELQAVARRDARFFYVPLVTREPEEAGWTGRRGRVDTILEPETFSGITGFALDPAQCHVFLCGNPGMVDGLEASLGKRGFRKHTPLHPGNLHLEKYW
jgi:ferredoxin--NADP+ reductase